MAGTMPHAIFVETDVDANGLVAAYAAELPGCAVFASTADEAAGGMPLRVRRFTAWLREHGESATDFVGDNWYEVERAAATTADGGRRRAAFTLDELPPSDDELATWLRWLELAREELAEALDAGAKHLLLDNLTPPEAASWVREIAGRATVELSGGITLENVRAYAETGAEFVSSGAVTHSARAMDISFRLELV